MIQIDKIIPGGQALATADDGKKLFFWNALPGETVTDYRITKSKSHYAEAIATALDHLSPERVEPRDACYLSTSPWQIMSYDYELTTKRALVVELFREHGVIIDTPPIHTDGREYFYRNKMEYSLYYDHNASRILPSFHIRGSHGKFKVTGSSIERPEIFSAATSIIDDLNVRGEEARKYQSLLLRADQSGHVSGGLFENGKPHPVFDNLTDTILGRTYSYSPNGFFQINLPVYEMALSAMKPFVTTDHILDLYSGVGTIGLSIADGRALTLVEVDRSAYTEMIKNVAASGQPATPILAKSEEVLDQINSFATVILDPPRAGCDPALISRLLEVAPPTIIYLSCNPATQARDVAALLAKYHLTTVQTFNFFPRTPHIENLVVLSL